ncbi:oxidoreductase [Fervidobacterium thailandense]|uniref:Oxidoreductase n=1 Tax=Fervidobacterium thailandense TaxID=1008305 RepID=A0A1E3G319_9BACT|nr:oxidoreductase [Fervidobacterium thailandense]ODN30609.1 oxidoreductase [Fervidobacterium thailandense]
MASFLKIEPGKIKRYFLSKTRVFEITTDTFFVVFEETVDFKPGQFAMVGTETTLTRKPFTLGLWDGRLAISVKVVGEGSRYIVETDKPIEIIAPLGNPFRPPETKGAVLVAPSCVAEGIHLAETFDADLYICSKTPLNAEFLAMVTAELDRVKCVVGDEAFIRLLDEITEKGYPWIFVSGSKKMEEIAYKRIRSKSKEIEVYLSLNEYMGCGIGACKSCAVETVDGIKHVCTDGPVFRGDAVWTTQ